MRAEGRGGLVLSSTCQNCVLGGRSWEAETGFWSLWTLTSSLEASEKNNAPALRRGF